MLDDQESLIALYQLFSAMDPVTVNIQVHHNSVYITACITFFSFPGIFHCSDEKQVTDITGQSYEVDGNSMHNDGADDNPLS